MTDTVRFAARRLARRPGLVVAVVTTIALGVGATTAIYSALRAVLLEPFPFPDAGRIVAITEDGPQPGLENFGVALPTAADWRAQASSLQDLALEIRPGGPQRIILGGGDGEPRLVAGALVSMNWFTLLGVPMALGRAFTEADSAPAGTRLAVLGSEFWRSHFGGDSAVIGRTIILNGAPYSIVGVAVPGLHRADDLWIPASTVVRPSLLANRQAHLFTVLGRLARGVTLERARDELALISTRLAAAYPESNRGWTPRVVPLREQIAGRTGPALLALMAAVLFVLLIASANVANVLLASGAARAPEFALRIALGASRRAIARDVMAEAALLAVAGGTVGLLLAVTGMRALRVMAAGIVPRAGEMSLDGSSLAVALGASLLAIAIGGIPPAVFAVRGAAADGLRDVPAGAGRSVARARTQQGLIVAQTALAMVLLTGAALLLKAMVRLRSTDLGFRTGRVAVATFNLPRAAYGDDAARGAFVHELLARLSAAPGVHSAAVAGAVPGGRQNRMYFGIAGRSVEPGNQPVSHVIPITPGYFTVLDIPLVAGRPILATDREETARVAVVDELFADRYFPGASALGQRVLTGDTIPREIVGVVGHALHGGPADANLPAIYLPVAQSGLSGDPNVLVRAQVNVAAVARQIHEQIRKLGPGVPVYQEQPLEAQVARSFGTTRLFSWLAALFGGCAVALACIGVYGVLAFSVAQRRRDIGVRMALGAPPARVVRDVVASGLAVTAVGVACGLAAALWLTRSLAAVLHSVSPTDAPSFLLAALVFLAVAGVASLIPAMRAGRVDPLAALRGG